jgi:indolepyruvate ferredoxin oxidoreductase beta subunit
MSSNFNMIIAGLGGQGIVSAGRILSEAALKEGLDFKTYGSYGMAQRGGSVHIHFRTGEIYFPKIVGGSCDLLLSFELMECLRNAGFMRSSGTIILNRDLVAPAGTVVEELNRGADEMENLLREKFQNVFVLEIGKRLDVEMKKALNAAMIGAGFASSLIPISVKNIKDSIALASPKRKDANLKAFDIGFEAFQALKA